MGMVRLETERLVIRDYRESDILSFHTLVSDQTTMRYLPGILCRDEQQSAKMFREAVDAAMLRDRTKHFFAVCQKSCDKTIGGIGFTIIRKGIGHLGYFYMPQYWGKGYATEAAKAVFQYAFETIGLHKIVTGCLKENVGSEKVMIKCGMRKEADLRQHIWHEDQWKDRVEYGLINADWLKRGIKTSQAYR